MRVAAAPAFAGWFTTTDGSRRHLMVASGWAVAAAVFAFFGTRGAQDVQPGHRQLDILAYSLVVIASLLIAVVWTWPRPVFVLTSALVTVCLARYYPAGPVYLVVVAMAAVLGWRESLERSYPWALLAGVALAVGGALHLEAQPLFVRMLNVLAWALVPTVPWGVTAMIRMRRTSTREAAAAQRRRQVDDERIRMAREVHDGVGHSLAVISMQAGVALHVADRRPEQARTALEAIARSSRDALTELRDTLAVLRGDDAPHAPAAGLSDLPGLVADFTATGHPVHLRMSAVDGLPATHDLAGYRIVQESLTNAARHAAHAATEVTVDGSQRCLVIGVRNALAGRPAAQGRSRAGSGLIGMEERCLALGGTFEAGPTSDGGWQVHAVLPLDRA